MVHATADELVKTVQEAQRIVFITGAGVSTESGIPDFESIDNDWPQALSRDEVFSRAYWQEHPDDFWRIYRESFQWANAMPNDFHSFPKRLAASGRYVHVLTQNVDGLHGEDDAFAAGESLTLDVDNAEVVDPLSLNIHNEYGQLDIVEAHGNADYVVCVNLQCSARAIPYELHNYSSSTVTPKCAHCESVMKPNISLFGEGIQGYRETLDAIVNCDLLIVAGTSLKVGPVNELPNYLDYQNGSMWADGIPGASSDNLQKKAIWVNHKAPPRDYTFHYSYLGNATDFARLFS